eukprot:maker-scaffold390_size186308-snap-gene-0.34 protein:Tk06351 transcript:maker-scaffold390_size186308-snap-gene-0.34-mRNA-1 annotation:"polymorphic outer membrane protein g i family"
MTVTLNCWILLNAAVWSGAHPQLGHVPSRGPPFNPQDSPNLEERMLQHFSTNEHPFFSWTLGEEKQPKMSIHYSLHESDQILLAPHDPMPDVPKERKSSCNYLGRLANDTRATLAVTGCLGIEPTEVTVLGTRHKGAFLLSGDEVEEIPLSMPEGPESRMSIELPDALDWILMEGDELMLITDEKKILLMEQICPLGACTDLPPFHELTIQVGYDTTFFNKVPNPEEWISQVLTHAQAHFYHPSLLVQIRLKILGAPKKFPEHSWRASTSDLKVARTAVMAESKANLYVLFCDDPEYFGTVGIAFVGGVCSTNGLHLSLNEWRNTIAGSARVVAHEIGHNLGMNHDFSAKYKSRGCTGIMDYGDSPAIWSKCSQEDFRSTYRLELSKRGQHCMATLDVSPDDGTYTPPEVPKEQEGIKTDDGKFTCPAPLWRGDGYCDDMNNVKACGFDAGDCCDKRTAAWNAFCVKCECVGPNITTTTPKPMKVDLCPSPHFKGDGFCDDNNNLAACQYDGGDCCSRRKNWNFFCQECKCIGSKVP